TTLFRSRSPEPVLSSQAGHRLTFVYAPDSARERSAIAVGRGGPAGPGLIAPAATDGCRHVLPAGAKRGSAQQGDYHRGRALRAAHQLTGTLRMFRSPEFSGRHPA